MLLYSEYHLDKVFIREQLRLFILYYHGYYLKYKLMCNTKFLFVSKKCNQILYKNITKLVQINMLKKRAYLARFLVDVDIPDDFLLEEDVNILYAQYEVLREHFKATHRHLEAIHQMEKDPSDYRQLLENLETEHEHLVPKVAKLKAKLQVGLNVFRLQPMHIVYGHVCYKGHAASIASNFGWIFSNLKKQHEFQDVMKLDQMLQAITLLRLYSTEEVILCKSLEDQEFKLKQGSGFAAIFSKHKWA